MRVSVKGRPLRTARVHVVDDDLLYTEVPCEIDADGSLVLRLAPAAFACVEIESGDACPPLDAKREE